MAHEEDDRIIDALTAHPDGLRQDELEDHVGVGPEAIYSAILRLSRDDRIEYHYRHGRVVWRASALTPPPD